MPLWLFSKSTWAVIVGIALITGVYFAVISYGSDRFDAGANSVRAELLKKYSDREKKIAGEFAKVVDERERKRKEALKEVDDLRNRPPEVVTNEIIKIVKNNECKRVSDGVVIMLNSSGIDASK